MGYVYAVTRVSAPGTHAIYVYDTQRAYARPYINIDHAQIKMLDPIRLKLTNIKYIQ